jgi:hypothetical protein
MALSEIPPEVEDNFEDNVEWQLHIWVLDHPPASPQTAAPEVEAPRLHAKLLRERREAYTAWALECGRERLTELLRAARQGGA